MKRAFALFVGLALMLALQAGVAFGQLATAPHPGGAGAGDQTAPAGGGDQPGPPPLPAPTPPPLPPTPPPLPPAAQYYYNNNGQPAGPISLEELIAKLKAGAITGDTLVWKTGTPNWVAARTLPELAAAVPKEEEIKRFLIGTWESETTTDYGGVSVVTKLTITYSPDGTFTGAQTTSMAGNPMPGVTQPLAGTWTVQKLTDKSFTLTATITGMGAVSYRITILDDNTLRTEETGAISHRLQ